MHTDLSPHLHTEECNKFIYAYKKCMENNFFSKFFGHCDRHEHWMSKCLKKERLARRKINADKAKAKNVQRQSNIVSIFDDERWKFLDSED